MEIKRIRVGNINYWAEKLGRKLLSQKLGQDSENYVNQLCRGHGSFGDATARKIEDAIGLRKGWMDNIQDVVLKYPAEDSFDLVEYQHKTSQQEQLINIASDFSEKEMAELRSYAEFIQLRKVGAL